MSFISNKDLKKTAVIIFRSLLLFYILLGVFIFLFQKSFIYHPPSGQDFKDCSGFQDYQKINYKGTRFYYKSQNPKKALVHYHGNATSACGQSYFRSVFERSGRSLLFVEYSGYTKEDQNPKQKDILADVRNVNEFLQKNSFQDVAVYGQSVGSGAAAYHASRGGADSLVLVSPFSSLSDLAQSKMVIYPASLLIREKYNNIEWLQNYQGKVVILHGSEDRVVPPRFSRKLFNNIESPEKDYINIPGKGHNDIWSSDKFKNKIIKAIQ